jgi:hypothetical protein
MQALLHNAGNAQHFRRFFVLYKNGRKMNAVHAIQKLGNF